MKKIILLIGTIMVLATIIVNARGGGVVAPTNIMYSYLYYYDVINPNQSIVIDISPTKIHTFKKIIINNSDYRLENADLTINLLLTNPVVTPADEKVYLYFEVLRENIDYNKTQITLFFNVSEDWIVKNIVPLSLSVYGHKGDNWTKISIKDNSFTLIRGYTTYAIGGKLLSPKLIDFYVICGNISYYFKEREDVSYKCINDSLYGRWSEYFEWISQTFEEVSNNTEKQELILPPEKQTLSKSAIAWIIVGIIVIISGIGYYKWQKKEYKINLKSKR